jgi:hypothetical protein
MSDIPINLTGNLSPDEQYLWDATGTPSPLTLAIESALGTQKYSGKSLTIGPSQLARRWTRFAKAAAVLLVAAAVLIFLLTGPQSIFSGWTISTTSGKPKIAAVKGKALGGDGTRVTTDSASTALLTRKEGPRISLGPSSEATVTEQPGFELANGEAFIQVPAQVPAAKVQTPSFACTFAPGTAATIQANDGGSQVAVKAGWAEVTSGDEHVRITDAMGCSSSPKSGTLWPPYRVPIGKTSNEMAKRLDEVLFGKLNEKVAYFKLEEALKTAQPTDAALLWNTLARVQESQRPLIRDRLAKLVKNPPKGEAFDAVLKLDQAAMDAWWNAVVGR